MTHGCTEPSSTLQPYAFAIAPHNRTDPIGANANAPIRRRARKYQSHGNLLLRIVFIIGILNHTSQVNVFLFLLSYVSDLAGRPRVFHPSPTPRRTESAPICALPENAPDGRPEFSQTPFYQRLYELDRRHVR